MSNTAPIEKYVPAVRNSRELKTNYPTVFGGISSNTATPNTLASAATVSFSPTATVTQHTPTQAETINFVNPTNVYTVGTEIFLEIITSGTTSYTLTFGTNCRSQGTLATGTTTAKIFLVDYVYDGTQWVEVSRTSAE